MRPFDGDEARWLDNSSGGRLRRACCCIKKKKEKEKKKNAKVTSGRGDNFHVSHFRSRFVKFIATACGPYYSVNRPFSHAQCMCFLASARNPSRSLHVSGFASPNLFHVPLRHSIYRSYFLHTTKVRTCNSHLCLSSGGDCDMRHRSIYPTSSLLRCAAAPRALGADHHGHFLAYCVECDETISTSFSSGHPKDILAFSRYVPQYIDDSGT